jgi:hypothetical protein
MSIPLPRLPRDDPAPNCFLDPDERYEIFEVKAAERPHLLSVACEENEHDSGTTDPPLLDGCDIPAWRNEGLAGPISPDILGALRIGAGSCMFRRDSQWPCLYNHETRSPWEILREKLLIPPSHDIPRVDEQEVSQQVNGTTKFAMEWEQRNVPVLIENCTGDWKAMPVYEKDNLDANIWNGGGRGGWM